MPYQFRADPRNGMGAASDPCGVSCCCQQITAVPGETNGVSVNYMPWVAPLGGRGLTNPTTITVVKLVPDGTPDPNAPPDTTITVPTSRIVIQGTVLTFPIVASGDAVVGDVYRLTVKQAAMDCDTAFYYHVSCYDVAVVKC